MRDQRSYSERVFIVADGSIREISDIGIEMEYLILLSSSRHTLRRVNVREDVNKKDENIVFIYILVSCSVLSHTLWKEFIMCE